MTQLQRLKRHLRKHKQIDPMTALKRYGIYRLSARVKNLRDQGMTIVTTRKKGSKLAVYRLA